MVKVHIWLYRN